MREIKYLLEKGGIYKLAGQVLNNKIEKTVDRVIDVWQLVINRHPEWSLDIYGDGTQKDLLVHKIKEKKLEDSIHILTSRYEGFGLTLIEAMAHGLPCIAYDCPHGPRNIIQDKKNGLLVSNGDTALMAEKICFLIENEEIRKNMGEVARQSAQAYAPDKIMQDWNALFTSITKIK